MLFLEWLGLTVALVLPVLGLDVLLHRMRARSALLRRLERYAGPR